MKKLALYTLCFFTLVACQAQEKKSSKNQKITLEKSNEEWRKVLSPEQYHVLREKGTERPGSGEYNLHFEDGVYTCAGCNAPLFKSDSKFDAHCGWPSFDQAISDSAILEFRDTSHGMVRTEIVCANCNGHLGHVFPDGPTQTGMRYCINSVSLNFENQEDKKQEK